VGKRTTPKGWLRNLCPPHCNRIGVVALMASSTVTLCYSGRLARRHIRPLHPRRQYHDVTCGCDARRHRVESSS
jgi:hypothetical protein